MKIISISGTQCSGKTYLATPFLTHSDVAFWDILDFYKREKCIVDDKMIWSQWDKTRHLIVPKLKKFFEQNKDKRVCLVETGTNQIIAKLFSTMETIDIQLRTPDKDVLIERAKKRKLDPNKVIAFSDVFLRRHAHNDVNQYTQEEAHLVIKAFLTLNSQEAMAYKLRLDEKIQIGR